jgi:hypothetical protein
VHKVFNGFRPIKPEEKVKIGSKDKTPAKKFCSVCHNEATQFAIFESAGVTVLERYCDSCISQNKHLTNKKILLYLLT